MKLHPLNVSLERKTYSLITACDSAGHDQGHSPRFSNTVWAFSGGAAMGFNVFIIGRICPQQTNSFVWKIYPHSHAGEHPAIFEIKYCIRLHTELDWSLICSTQGSFCLTYMKSTNIFLCLPVWKLLNPQFWVPNLEDKSNWYVELMRCLTTKINYQRI